MRAVLAIALLLVASDAWGLGFESFGNDPVEDSNYKEWPNVLPLANDPHRIYHSWVNGNEHFYYSGDHAALNAALKSFAAIQAEKLTVVLRPAPGRGSSLKGDRDFEFNWKLHLLGGIAAAMSREDLAINIWDPTPYLHVYVGNGIKLDDLEIPDGVEVLEIADLKARYAKCLASTDRAVRGWCCGEIAELDPYDGESMQLIASRIDDHDDWVKSNAVGALSHFAHNAGEVIERLESVKTDDQALDARIGETIEKLRTVKADDAARERFQESLASITAYVQALRTEQ
jgi:hypothetical protein